MRKTILTYGFLAGAILGGVMIASLPFMNGGLMGALIGYTTMVLAFLLVYFGVRSYRDNVAGGRITFGKAMLVGSAIALIGICCYVATWEVIYFKVTPDFAEKYAAHQIDRMRAAGASEAMLAQKQKEMDAFAKAYHDPIINIAYTFLEPLPVALIMTLISAGMVKRKEALPA